MQTSTVYATAVELYEQGGQDAVLDFANWLESNKHVKFDWRTCEPCEYTSPHLLETDGSLVCLVCGTTASK